MRNNGRWGVRLEPARHSLEYTASSDRAVHTPGTGKGIDDHPGGLGGGYNRNAAQVLLTVVNDKLGQ